MSNPPSIKKNIAYNSIYNILVILVPLIVSPYVARVLGVEGVGLYSITFTIANYFKRASHLGMEKYGNRSIALVKDDPERRSIVFWTNYKVQFCWGIICLLIYYIYLLSINGWGTASWLQSLLVLSALFDVSWYFFGEEKFKTVVFVSTACKLIYLLSVFLFVKHREDTWIYILISALGYLIPSIIIFTLALSQEKFRKSEKSELLSVAKGAFLLFIPVVAVTVYKSMDKLMLGIMSETTFENGLYENAEKILHVPIAVISAVSAVLMPRMTKMYRDKRDDVAGHYIFLTIKYSAFMSIACACGLAGIASIFSVVYWGNEFVGCAVLLRMFSISIPFMSFAEIIRTQYIIPNKQDSTYIVAVCAGAFVNLIINATLIPRLGAKGAVIGTVIAEATVSVYQAYRVRKALPIIKYCSEFLKYLPAGLLMAFILIFASKRLDYSVINLVLVVLIGGIVFCTISLIQIYLFDKPIWRIIRKGITEFTHK